MKNLVRTGLGYALFAGGLTFLVYGIAQAIENGSCGTDEYGNSVGVCPSGFGPMVALMVLGTFVAIIGAAVAAVRVSTIARLVFAGVAAVIAGVVLGFVDVHADDTRPGVEILLAVMVPLALFSVPGVRRASAPAVTFATPPPAPTTRVNADEIAERLRRLDQLRESGLLDEAAYKERRTQILAEL